MKTDHIVEALTGDSGWKDMIPQVDSSDFPTQWVPSAYECSIIDAQAKEIEKLRGQLPRWVPVEEHLPENGVPVLINYIASSDGKYHPDGTAVWTDYGCFWWEGSLEDCDTEVAVPITHWMPLPEPPEVEKALEAMKDE